MYETFYKLSAEPFRLSPDPRFCFEHRTYRKAMIYMRHALLRAEGFIMITGRPGTGKTTLINDLLRALKPDQAMVANLVTTQMTADDLIRLVAYSYNLDPEGADKVDVLVKVVRFLKQQYQQGRRPLLIVDEAQGMAEGALEELRLLTNLQVDGKQLLQIFLVGQEELRDVVNSPSMEQLHQRMIAATHLEPLDRHDTEAYIKHRLRRVAWTGDPLISKEAYAMIQQYSQGIPRQINQICSRLFLHGNIEEKNRLGMEDVKIVIEELREELLMPVDTAEITAEHPQPADRHQETYEVETRRTTAPAAPTNPPTTKVRQQTEPARQHSNTVVPATPPSMPETEAAAVTSPATSNKQDPEQQAAMTAKEPVTGTNPDASINQERKQQAAHTDREAEAVTEPGTGPAEEAVKQATNTATEPASVITREPLKQPSSTAREASSDTPPRQAPTKLQEKPAANRAAARKNTVGKTAAANPAVHVTVQENPIKKKVQKRISWVLLVVTGLLTGLSLAMMYNPELPRLAGQELKAWVHSGIHKGVSIVTGESSPDITEPDEAMGKGTVVRKSPPVSHEAKTGAAEIETAVQEPDLDHPQAKPLQLQEQLQQSGLLVERMDNGILKVDLSSDGMFAFDSTELKEGARPALGKLADVLRKHDELTIQVVGHTDSSGAADYNLHLSQLRAKAVADYLISQGITDSSIESEGRGDRDTRLEQPAIYNPGLKRRVEIYIRQAR